MARNKSKESKRKRNSRWTPSFIICMTVERKESEEDQVDTYMVEISGEFVEALTQVDTKWRHLHDHRPRENPGFFSSNEHIHLLSSSNILPETPNIAIGSTLYHFQRTVEDCCTQDCPPGCESSFHPQIQSCNTSDDDPKWSAIPPPPHSATRYFPSLVALRGRLYVIGGVADSCEIDRRVTFGEVFDPVTQSWADLKSIPRHSGIDVRPFLMTSLGDEEGKILLVNTVNNYEFTEYRKKAGPKYTHVAYNIAKAREGWEDFKDPELCLGYHVSGCVASVETEKTIYWLDEKGQFNSYNWDLKELSSGPVVGLSHEAVLQNLDDHHDDLSLLHLWSDFFCLVWSWPSMTEPQQKTSLHRTFLRVVKSSTYSSVLFAHVVGCSMNWIDGDWSLRGAVLVS